MKLPGFVKLGSNYTQNYKTANRIYNFCKKHNNCQVTTPIKPPLPPVINVTIDTTFNDTYNLTSTLEDDKVTVNIDRDLTILRVQVLNVRGIPNPNYTYSKKTGDVIIDMSHYIQYKNNFTIKITSYQVICGYTYNKIYIIKT